MKLVDEAIESGARKSVACKELGIDVRTLQRWKASTTPDDGRKGPKERPSNRLTDEEEERLIAILNSEEFMDLPPNQVVVKLADLGWYFGSERTMYRLLKKLKLQRHRESSRPKRKVKSPRELVADGPCQVFSWDITYLPTVIKGQFFFLYMMMDVWSRKIVAAQVHPCESDELASQFIANACANEDVVHDSLTVHSDNGSVMKGQLLVALMDKMGVDLSYSRPSVSNDNPYSESLFRTMKYRPAYPNKPFADIAAAMAWVEEFVRWYNEDHQHSGICFVTPSQRHAGVDIEVLRKRERVYQEAREKHPNRWSGDTRNWTHIKIVTLNPGRDQKKKAASAESPEKRTPSGAQGDGAPLQRPAQRAAEA